MNQDKVASLLGFTKQQLLIRRGTEHWIKARSNGENNLLGRMAEIDIARSIFSAWDHTEKGYLTIVELSEELVTLGLSTDVTFVECLMYTIKARRSRKANP